MYNLPVDELMYSAVRQFVHTAIVLLCPAAAADDESGPVTGKPDDRASRFVQLARERAATFEARFHDDSSALVEFHEDPVLGWTNPVAGEIYGGVFLWTRGGRPAFVAAMYKWYSPYTHMGMELHSVSSDSFTLLQDGRRIWSPSRAGIEFHPIDDAPDPLKSRAGRLRQLRQLARNFSAEETDREDVVRALRLLPQPLYRYDSTDADVIDGALFAFANGTDPDILLLIEARKTDSGFAWQYAAARLNSIRLRVFLSDREVWSTERLPWSEVRDRTQPYTAMQLD